MLLSLNSVLSPRDVASAHRGRGWILLSVESPLSVSAFPLAKCSALLQYMREGVPLRPPFKIRSNPNGRYYRCQGKSGNAMTRGGNGEMSASLPLALAVSFVLGGLSYVMLVPSSP